MINAVIIVGGVLLVLVQLALPIPLGQLVVGIASGVLMEKSRRWRKDGDAW